MRKNFEFDLLLEIKGFTEDDAYCYIKKHFQNVGPNHSSKGETLAKEVKENKLLNALRNNPLNLLLLCVIHEDYDGKLPASRTELYQVIVQCLLRRYCAKQSLVVPEDNNTLKKRFDEDILALGELAWTCLLNDRQSFREEELAEREVRNKNLVARRIGLLYKEERLKRILRSQYEYWFLHKTFQEYLAAAFITHKLQKEELNVFQYTTFDDLVQKYPQVFVFVSGMLGEKATMLFTQIGVQLMEKKDWDWEKCSEQASTFFVESFSESGHAEQMALALCSYIPFPQQVQISELIDTRHNIFHVLKACRSFRNLQQPVKLTVHEGTGPHRFQIPGCLAEYIESCSQLQALSVFSTAVTSGLAKALHHNLSGHTTLSEFSLQICGSFPCEAAVVIGELLAACKALRKVTFQLDRVWGENWASTIEAGLSADTPLNSVDLQVRGSLSDSAAHGLEKLLSNKALASFSLNISGDVQELLTAVISRGIAEQTALKLLAFSVDGNLGLSCVNAIQNSLLDNHSLSDLELTLRGEIPDNWQSVVENLRSVKKWSLYCTFHPDPGSSVTGNQVAHFHPAVVETGLKTKQHLTVVLWGELKCRGAEDLCEILVRVPLTSLTLKVHGKLSDGVVNIIKRYIGQQHTLSSLTIDIWRKLSPRTGALLQELSNNNLTVQVKEHGFSVVPKEACNALDVSIDNPASLTAMFSEVNNTRKERINLKIINHDEVVSDWPRLLGDALAENTLLTMLDLTVINTMNPGIGKDLGYSLLRSSSLTVLSLTTSNHSKMAEGWECTLVNSVAKMASVTTLSLAIDDRGKVRKFRKDLMAVRSLFTLSVVINGSNLTYFWGKFLRKCLEECNSLTKLRITSNNYKEEHENNPYDDTLDPFFSDINSTMTWEEGLSFGLASTTSLKELNMTINNVTCTDSAWRDVFCMGLPKNKSITSLTVTVSYYEYLRLEFWVGPLKRCLVENKWLTTLTLTVNDYCETEGNDDCSHLYILGQDNFPENSSLTELNLTVNIRSEVSEDWLPSFCDCLMMNCSSLRTVRLHVNNHCATSKSRIYDLSKLRLKYRSLSRFELSVTFCGE